MAEAGPVESFRDWMVGRYRPDGAFDPFFSTKGRGRAGLGLSEVYGITKRHNGRVEIESARGSGTTVRLVLPLATSDSAAGARARSDDTAVPSRD